MVRAPQRGAYFALLAVIAVVVLATAALARAHSRNAPHAHSRRAPEAHGAGAARGLHVSGNRLLDAHGRRLILRGVNRSGSEYACIQGWGIFDGPSTAASVQAMAAWHMNFVRVPLNEDCWLGINGVKRAYGVADGPTRRRSSTTCTCFTSTACTSSCR